jgi:hypothetical protein
MGLTEPDLSSLVVSHTDHFQVPSVTIKNGLAVEATQRPCKSKIKGPEMGYLAQFIL